MNTHENMQGLVSSAANDPSIDKFFFAKNALQLKLAQELMPKSLKDPDSDYDAFITFTQKYGEALKEIIKDNPALAERVLGKVIKDPDAPLDAVDLAQIKALFEAPQYSKYLH